MSYWKLLTAPIIHPAQKMRQQPNYLSLFASFLKKQMKYHLSMPMSAMRYGNRSLSLCVPHDLPPVSYTHLQYILVFTNIFIIWSIIRLPKTIRTESCPLVSSFFGILIIDQIIKILVKTNMYWHESIRITDWFYI